MQGFASLRSLSVEQPVQMGPEVFWASSHSQMRKQRATRGWDLLKI